MPDCIFCQIIEGKLPSKPVYQDEDILVIPDIHPQAPVHLLVMPKKHIPDFMETDSDLLLKIMNRIKKVIIDQHIREYRLVTNGKGAAVVDHLHLHILGNVDKYRTL